MKNKQALTLVALASMPGLALAHASSDGAAHFHDLSEALKGAGGFAGLFLVAALFLGLAVTMRRQLKRARARQAAHEVQP